MKKVSDVCNFTLQEMTDTSKRDFCKSKTTLSNIRQSSSLPTQVLDLKTSVAELSSSRAQNAGSKHELEASRWGHPNGPYSESRK